MSDIKTNKTQENITPKIIDIQFFEVQFQSLENKIIEAQFQVRKAQALQAFEALQSKTPAQVRKALNAIETLETEAEAREFLNSFEDFEITAHEPKVSEVEIRKGLQYLKIFETKVQSLKARAFEALKIQTRRAQILKDREVEARAFLETSKAEAYDCRKNRI